MLPRICVPNPLDTGARVALERAPAHHLLKVLRQREGDEVALFNGDGFEYRGTLMVEGRNAIVQIERQLEGPPASPLAITLVQGISRGDRMDFALQKATELGVAAIQPVLCERGAVKLGGDRLAKKYQHWSAVITSACEQCGRCELPQLYPAQALGDYLAGAAAGLLLDPEQAEPLSALALAPGEISVLIGPESGLSGGEIDAARAAGWRGLRLGPRVLRTETAAIAAVTALQLMAGDLAQG